MKTPVIAIGCDHAGFEYKELIKEYLTSEGFSVKDFGTNSAASVDYPDFVHPLAESIEKGETGLGILICGSANGVPIESVSKMLGHKSLRTTQHYAKIVDRKVSDDMMLLKEKFALKEMNITHVKAI